MQTGLAGKVVLVTGDNSASPSQPQPSAIFDGIEDAARRI